MAIVLVRIDDRYIHGQVTYSAVKASGANEIWVVSDKLYKNPVLKKIQLAVAPKGVKVEILSLSDAIEKIKSREHEEEDRRIFIITESPKDTLTLIDNGLKIDWINVGAMAWKQGKVRIAPTVHVDGEDIKYFMELVDRGIDLIYRQYHLTVAPPVNLNSKIRELAKKI